MGRRKGDTNAPIEERLSRTTDKSGECWIWTGFLNPSGYGMVGYLGVPRLAHRVAWIVNRGPIPDGLVLDHLCRTRSCVNPDHLEPITQAENNLRSGTSVTVCPAGHAYTEENTYRGSQGRYCKECHRTRQRERMRRIRKATQ